MPELELKEFAPKQTKKQTNATAKLEGSDLELTYKLNISGPKASVKKKLLEIANDGGLGSKVAIDFTCTDCVTEKPIQ